MTDARSLSPGDLEALAKDILIGFEPLSQAQMPASGEPPAVEASSEEQLQNLLVSCREQDAQVEQLLEKITQICGGLTFQVPVGATEVRAALISLNMNPNQVSYRDYLELLRLQLKLAQSMSTEVARGLSI